MSLGALPLVLLALATGTPRVETTTVGSVNDPALMQVAAKIRRAIEAGDATALLAEVAPGGIYCGEAQMSLSKLSADMQKPGFFWALLFDSEALKRHEKSLDPVYSMREFFSRDAGAQLKAALQAPPSEEFVLMCWQSEVVGPTAQPPCFMMRRLGPGRWVIVQMGC